MQRKSIVLTEEDKAVLDSYKNVVEGLAAYLGEGYELVLHSLESLNHSVIKIINGHHTGRKEGAPITNLALTMLDRIEEDPENGYIHYFSKNKKGEPMKSATIAIYGSHKRVIGLLCINFYMNTPLFDILGSFTEQTKLQEGTVSETFAEDTKELVLKSIVAARHKVESDASILPSNKNKEIIQLLWNQNIFELKDAVSLTAQELNISINTVYLHIRTIKKSN